MSDSRHPSKLRTALVLGSIALTIFLGYIVRIWIFGK